MAQHFDYTRTAGSLRIGETVNDDETYDRIVIDQMHEPTSRDLNGLALNGDHVRFMGRREKAGDEVLRCWPVEASVTVVSRD